MKIKDIKVDDILYDMTGKTYVVRKIYRYFAAEIEYDGKTTKMYPQFIDPLMSKKAYQEYKIQKELRIKKQQEERLKLAEKEKLLRKQKLEQEKIQEAKDKETLLILLEKFGFVGFLHTANFNNFVNIYKSNLLKSRNQLLNEGFKFVDNAETSVLEHTNENIKSKVRFYYRPITPTNYSAYMWHNQKNPVMLIFDKNLIFEEDVSFCDGCAGSSSTTETKKAKNALNFNWEEIFSTGPFNNDDFIKKNHRNAEFLTASPVSVNKATKICFRNYEDYVKACKLFGQDSRFKYNPKLFC